MDITSSQVENIVRQILGEMGGKKQSAGVPKTALFIAQVGVCGLVAADIAVAAADDGRHDFIAHVNVS